MLSDAFRHREGLKVYSRYVVMRCDGKTCNKYVICRNQKEYNDMTG